MKKKVNLRSLKNLRSWQKGVSGNPGGRPKKLLGEAYLKQLGQIKKGDPQKRTFAELIANAQIKKAMKGNTVAAKEICDRTEGKARQAVDLASEAPLDFNLQVSFVDSDGNGRPKPEDACPSCSGTGRDESGGEDCPACGGTRMRSKSL